MTETFFVFGNLKMYLLSREEVKQYLSMLRREWRSKQWDHVTVVLCPPYPYLHFFDDVPRGVRKGAQNVFWEKNGAYTGEISPVMLKNEGVEYVLIGHSERRQYAGESNDIVRKKVDMTLKCRLTPVVCIGETMEERRKGVLDAVLEHQVGSIFSGLSRLQAENIIIAYEPRWAVGTDALPTTQDILQVKVMLRKIFTTLYDAKTAQKIRVLYGGSVKASFLPAVSFEAEMDGVLVGRESLFPHELAKMAALFEAESRRNGSRT